MQAGYPPEDTLDEADLAAAKWAWENDRASRTRRRHAARRQAAVPPDAHRPRRVGVVGIDSDKPGPLLTPDQRRLLDALIDQAAWRSSASTWSRTWTAPSARWRRSGCAPRC